MIDERYYYLSVINRDMVKYKLPKRKDVYNKGDFGKLLCICGSRSMPGAASFAISAALRCGVGTIKSCVVPSIYGTISSRIPETTFCVVKENSDGYMSKNSINTILDAMKDCSAAVIGCGLGWNQDTKFLVEEIIKNSNIPLVVDADGINVISENIDILHHSNCEIVLTPHPKEMTRLMGTEFKSLDKMGPASEFAVHYGVTVLLKGHRTVISNKTGSIFLNKTGNVGMAKGGSGDVLSGMIGSFLAQKLLPVDAAICGAFIHGFAGDKCAQKLSNVSMLPSDIVEELPSVFSEFEL